MGDQITRVGNDFHLLSILIHDPVHAFDELGNGQRATHNGVLLNLGLQPVKLTQQGRVFEQVRFVAFDGHVHGQRALKLLPQDLVADTNRALLVEHINP